jgi:hypothetical protein
MSPTTKQMLELQIRKSLASLCKYCTEDGGNLNVHIEHDLIMTRLGMRMTCCSTCDLAMIQLSKKSVYHLLRN